MDRNKEGKMLKAYEIYTKCPDTGTLGWDIARVWSTSDRIEQYPNFDCIITVNDCDPTETFMPTNEQPDGLTRIVKPAPQRGSVSREESKRAVEKAILSRKNK